MCDIHLRLRGNPVPDCVFCAAKPLVTQFRCCDCASDFKSEQALTQHLRDTKTHKLKKPEKKIEKATCAECQKTFEDRSLLQRHVESLGHKTEICEKCKKLFKNPLALKTHAESLRHNPLSDIQCLAHKKCKKRFNCPSAQLQHLESGRCKSKMTKKILNEAIARNDSRGIITSGTITTQWSLEDASSTSSTPRSQSPVFTPTSSQFFDSYPPSGVSTPKFGLPDMTEFNTALTLRLRTGTGLQKCPLCPPAKKREYMAGALRDHLSSSVHQYSKALVSSSLSAPEITFHCPSDLVGAGEEKKTKEFATVSGLAQHLESGACSGGKETMKRVVQYVQKELKNLGFGERNLLL